MKRSLMSKVIKEPKIVQVIGPYTGIYGMDMSYKYVSILLFGGGGNGQDGGKSIGGNGGASGAYRYKQNMLNLDATVNIVVGAPQSNSSIDIIKNNVHLIAFGAGGGPGDPHMYNSIFGQSGFGGFGGRDASNRWAGDGGYYPGRYGGAGSNGNGTNAGGAHITGGGGGAGSYGSGGNGGSEAPYGEQSGSGGAGGYGAGGGGGAGNQVYMKRGYGGSGGPGILLICYHDKPLT